jgi:integrase
MLTDRHCKNASCDLGKPRVDLAAAGGLYLEVSSAGSKRWFRKYRFDGKEKRLALGGYPDLGLKEARARRDDARQQHHQGPDPVLARQVEHLHARFDAEATFEVVARELHATKPEGWSDEYARRWLERLEKDAFPWLGKLPLKQVTAPMLPQTLRRVESRGVRELPHSLLELNGRPHLVPLASQAVSALQDIRPLTGRSRYVFPAVGDSKRPMSENRVRVALRRLGFDHDEMTPHGFRAMARTVLVERLNGHPDVIEAQLAHHKPGPLGAAYDRAEFIQHSPACGV